MTSVTAGGPDTHGTAPAPPRSTFRPELQGLRALAVTLVVVYHVWLGRVSGGVDVFFLISGFLVTGQLVRAHERGGVRLRDLWSTMARRLVPVASVVLVAVVVGSVLVLPQSRWVSTVREVVASALFLENWQLAADSVDYYAQNANASVVQHFWSLSIQGQFYLVWPLMVGLVALVARRAGTGLRRALLIALLGVTAASLAFSVALTAANQPLAYFHSLTRVWEFSLGGLLALTASSVVLPRVARVLLGWVGVVGLVACGVVLDAGSAFPGYLALWPVACAVMVLLAGTTGSRWAVDRLLVSRPAQRLGELSYCLYLWHWPLLVLWLVANGRSAPDAVSGLGVVAVSLVLAALTHHLVEKPVRDGRLGVVRSWGGFRLAALSLVPVLLLTGAWQAHVAREQGRPFAVDHPDNPGALARTPGFTFTGSPDADLVPSMVALPDDWAEAEGECRPSESFRRLEVCRTTPPGDPQRRVVVVGDSHMQQYLAALVPIAERRAWEVTWMLRGACPFSTDADAAPGDVECVRWNEAALVEITELQPDAVLTLATRDVRPGLTETTPPGFVAQWQNLDRVGVPVLAVRDNPRFDFSPPECLQGRSGDPADCSTPRSEVLADDPPFTAIDAVPANVSFLDFSDYVCEDEHCPAAIGNVLVYMDANHLTASFVATLAPVVERAIDDAMGW